MILKALLLTLVGIFGNCSHKFLGDGMFNRPLVVATLTGLVLGDFQTGLIMAGTLELTWMGVMYLGLSMPSDVTGGAIIGTAFAILSGSDVSVALALSIPAGILCAYVTTACDVLASFVVHKADKYAAMGQIEKVNMIHVGTGIGQAILSSSVIFIAITLGTEKMSWLVERLPESVMNGLNVVSGLLPALGFAMLINIMWDSRFIAFLFIGFVMAVYLEMPIMAVAVLAISTAIVYYFLSADKQEKELSEEELFGDGTDMILENAEELPDESNNSIVSSEKHVTTKDLRTIFWRSFFHEASFNAERMQALGYEFALSKLLKKLYGDDERAFCEACQRHVEFFNVTVQINNFPLGIVAAMEEKNANSKEKNLGATISAVKSSLMGPMSAIGDTFFWGCFRIIAASVGGALCLSGNPFGPIVFLVLFNIPNILVRWFGLKLGYKLGENFMDIMGEGGVFQRLTEAAYIIGLTVVGAMIADYVWMSFGLEFAIGESVIVIQEILDEIFLGLPGLIGTLLIAWLMRKKNVKPVLIILVILVIGIVFGISGILVA